MSKKKTDAAEQPKPQYVTDERTADGRLIARGELKHGFRIADQVHKTFEMQEAITEDLFAAEQSIPLQHSLMFNGALMCRQLVKVGDFEGPFTIGMIGKLKAIDYDTLRAAQLELDVLGEA